jgi:hypothetical protein
MLVARHDRVKAYNEPDAPALAAIRELSRARVARDRTRAAPRALEEARSTTCST